MSALDQPYIFKIYFIDYVITVVPFFSPLYSPPSCTPTLPAQTLGPCLLRRLCLYEMKPHGQESSAGRRDPEPHSLAWELLGGGARLGGARRQLRGSGLKDQKESTEQGLGFQHRELSLWLLPPWSCEATRGLPGLHAPCPPQKEKREGISPDVSLSSKNALSQGRVNC